MPRPDENRRVVGEMVATLVAAHQVVERLLAERGPVLIIDRDIRAVLQREGKVLEDRSSLVVLLFDLLTITTGAVMFCTEYLPKPMSKLPFIAHIGIFFALLLVAYALKLLCNELYAWLFGRDKEHSAINQYKFIFMTDFAILLFPLLVVIQYTGLREFYYAAAALLAILFSIWVYRLLKINSLEGHRFHFFLYFCTLEILPWLLFLKVMLII